MHEKYNATEPEKGPGAGGEYKPQVQENPFEHRFLACDALDMISVG